MKFLYALFIIAVFYGCAEKRVAEPGTLKTAAAPLPKPAGRIMPTDTHTISGDFDGDGITEKLTSYIADSTGTRLTNAYDPYEWDDTVTYYSKMGYGTVVKLDNGKGDELSYFANGLFCLVNLGDMNGDHKDEIALVPALLDWSNLNTCRIYSLCENKWTELNTIGVNEDAFVYAGSTEPVFDNIPGYLEKHKGKWMFRTHMDLMEAEVEDVPYRLLSVATCPTLNR